MLAVRQAVAAVTHAALPAGGAVLHVLWGGAAAGVLAIAVHGGVAQPRAELEALLLPGAWAV